MSPYFDCRLYQNVPTSLVLVVEGGGAAVLTEGADEVVAMVIHHIVPEDGTHTVISTVSFRRLIFFQGSGTWTLNTIGPRAVQPLLSFLILFKKNFSYAVVDLFRFAVLARRTYLIR